MIRQSEKKVEKEKKKKEYDYEDREMMKQILDCSRFLMLKMNGHETRASLFSFRFALCCSRQLENLVTTWLFKKENPS